MGTETNIDKIADILRLAARVQGGKSNLITTLNQEIGTSLSTSMSYKKILKRVLEDGDEVDFCRAIFNASSFEEVASKYAVAQGLSLLSAPEVLEVANYLSDDGHTWRYDKSTSITAIMSVTQKVSLGELNQCLSELMTSGRIELVTRQNKRWIIGPLGITQATQFRKAGDIWSLKKFFEEELHGALVDEFMQNAQWIPENDKITPDKSDQYKQQQLIQLALTHGKDSDIFSTINSLIANRLLNLKRVKVYDWNLIGTPCGVFTRQYNGVNRLAELIVSEFPEEQLKSQLSQKNYFSSDVKLGTIEMCLRDDPVSILTEFFGWSDLMRIGTRFDLVCVNSVSKTQLAEIITRRLGFDLPVHLEGLGDFIKLVEKSRIVLTEPTHTFEELQGIMTGIYRTAEAVLKDILHFYIGFLYPESLTDEEPGERRESFNRFCRKQLNLEKAAGIDGLTLGELIHIINKLNIHVKQDPKLQAKLKERFRRNSVIPSRALAILENSLRARKYIAHDKGQVIQKKEVMLQIFSEALGNISDFLHKLKKDNLYPRVIRVRSEITDEYGRRYVEAIDEDGKSWLIHSDEYLSPSESFFMHSVTDSIAIDPYLSAKL